MALFTNYPIALAPGMGINAYFAFTVCGAMKIPWQAALGLVFYSGLVFFVLSITGIRQRLLTALPRELKTAITCGIGLFIAFIGLKNGGVIVDNPATLVGLAAFNQPSPLMVMAGVVVAAARGVGSEDRGAKAFEGFHGCRGVGLVEANPGSELRSVCVVVGGKGHHSVAFFFEGLDPVAADRVRSAQPHAAARELKAPLRAHPMG